MNIKKNTSCLIILITLVLGFQNTNLFASTNVSGTISQNTTWGPIYTHPAVALAGRVPIEVGNLMVSSPFPRYAMKYPNRKCIGAIMGKALEALETGEGRILVLVISY